MHYFAYGSNMAAEQMDAWCEGHVCKGAARLPGRALEFRRRSVRWGAGAADIVEREGSETWGVLYEIPDSALEALDEKESNGVGYRRIEVEVEHGDDWVTAWAYEVIHRADSEVRPRDEYLGLLLSGGREWDLPEDYLTELEGRW